jgi:SHS2 domain-containing protein
VSGKNYELIEHTADIGIKIRGEDLKELFSNAASAMFDIMAEEEAGKKKSPFQEEIIEQAAGDLEELFINWLNELLSLSAIKRLIFFEFHIERIDEHSLQAKVKGCDINSYRVNTEIKAATYHTLKIEERPSGYAAEVIFDV